jgi:uncharacterized protein YecT (DUF1311 family)
MRLMASVACLGVLASMSIAIAGNCNDQSTQSDLNVCADQDFKAADKALNEVYRTIVKRLSQDSESKTRLTAAQKAWIAFRDAECDFQSGNSIQGSIYPMLVSICRTGLTKKRTEELKVYLKCDEGDTLCPVPAAE